MISFTRPARDDDVYISEELVGRLLRATEDGVIELVAKFQTTNAPAWQCTATENRTSAEPVSRLSAPAI
jgi:hypothetical protein